MARNALARWLCAPQAGQEQKQLKYPLPIPFVSDHSISDFMPCSPPPLCFGILPSYPCC